MTTNLGDAIEALEKQLLKTLEHYNEYCVSHELDFKKMTKEHVMPELKALLEAEKRAAVEEVIDVIKPYLRNIYEANGKKDHTGVNVWLGYVYKKLKEARLGGETCENLVKEYSDSPWPLAAKCPRCKQRHR